MEPDSKLSQQFEEVMAKVVGLHVNIEGTRDAGVETVLKTECVGVSKVVHILRASGDRLGNDELCKWDKHMRDSLGRPLNGELDDLMRGGRRCDGFQQGGLSWRTGLDLALPAFLASRVASRPAVESSLGQCGRGGHGQFGDAVGGVRCADDGSPGASLVIPSWRSRLENPWHGQRCGGSSNNPGGDC